MPEVGLELHSRPCELWTPAETHGIRPGPTDVRPDSIRSEGQGVQIVRTLIRARFVAGQNSAVTLMTGISVTGSTHPTAYVPNMVRISSRCRFH